jgi:hypothetical protein
MALGPIIETSTSGSGMNALTHAVIFRQKNSSSGFGVRDATEAGKRETAVALCAGMQDIAIAVRAEAEARDQ